MKLILACALVAIVVLADNVFFYDNKSGDMIRRTNETCYVMALTQDQQANVHRHEVNRAIEQILLDKEDDNSTASMSAADATPFIQHHCHDRELYRITQ